MSNHPATTAFRDRRALVLRYGAWEDSAACRPADQWAELNPDEQADICGRCTVTDPCRALGVALIQTYGVSNVAHSGAYDVVYAGRAINATARAMMGGDS